MDELVKRVDAILPQTQCKQCGYAGCLPYAEAVVKHGEAIDLCPPGGTAVLRRLAQLLKQDPTPLLPSMIAREQAASTVQIRPDECIGCTKCLQVCPVDAIVGAAKQMHVVLSNECTGCRLCLEACPVDCIDYFILSEPRYQPEQARKRTQARAERLKRMRHKPEDEDKDKRRSKEKQQEYIQAAIERVKQKRSKIFPL